MSLKCPICGQEYSYDRKVCQMCESKSIESGLICYEENKSQKWNCGIFLEFDTLAFGKQKSDELYTKIASEPKFYDCKPKEEYPWNCNSRLKFKNFFILESGISQSGTLNKSPSTDSIILEEEKK